MKRCPPPKFASFAEWPAPALDLYPHLSYIPWRTSRGCVNSCAYCATPFLCPRFEETLPAHAADAFLKLYDLRPAPDVAFYDDALLVNASKRLLPFLDHVCTALPNLRWHTPNGMHVRCVTAPIAERLYAAGFTTLRLGLETVNPARLASTGPKYAFNDVARCLSALTAAGFRPNTIGVYLLMGLPGQTVDEVRTAILYTREYLGLNVKLAEYSPVPHTSLWPAAVAESPVPIAREPLWHNNSLLPLRSPTFSQEIITDLRALAAGH
ncbi:MAG: radical SAM protein [bacterium]|nr:radical SAM protein [bacterium]